MPTRTSPEERDVVVQREKREGKRVYVLHTAFGPDQYLLRSRKEAIGKAVTCAKRGRVRAWLGDEGYDFVLLEDFRLGEVRRYE
jgi:hypothetical protein